MGNIDTRAPQANLKCHFWVLSEKGNTFWLLNKSFFFIKQKSYSCLLIKSVPQNVGVNPSVQQIILLTCMHGKYLEQNKIVTIRAVPIC